MEACTARGIVVCHTARRQSTSATAELTLGLLPPATSTIYPRRFAASFAS
jgi:phosphoglycerate dehydrogenase-like enzyme